MMTKCFLLKLSVFHQSRTMSQISAIFSNFHDNTNQFNPNGYLIKAESWRPLKCSDNILRTLIEPNH